MKVKEKLVREWSYVSVVGLNVLYVIIMVLSIYIVSYRFSDNLDLLYYLLAGVVISLVLSVGYIIYLKAQKLEITTHFNQLLLLQLPSTIIFFIMMLILFTSSYTFN